MELALPIIPYGVKLANSQAGTLAGASGDREVELTFPEASVQSSRTLQVSVTPSVAIVSSAVTSIVPLTAITSPGRAAAMAARSDASSDTVTVGFAGQVGETVLVAKDGDSVLV